MAYSEFIKNFQRTRDCTRSFFAYGCSATKILRKRDKKLEKKYYRKFK